MTRPPTPNPLAGRSLRAPVLWGVVWGVIQAAMPARRLPRMLRTLPAVLGPERVAALADKARIRFRAAA